MSNRWVHYTAVDLNRANRYLLKVLAILQTEEIQKMIVGFPTPLESLIWVNIIGIKTCDDLRDWISTFEQFSPNQRTAAFECNIAEDGSMSVSDTIWLQEARKPKNERDWDKVLTVLNALTEFAKRNNFEILWACSIRARIIVLAEYKKDLANAVNLANESLAIASNDPRVQFLIREITGRQYVLAKRGTDAIKWLDDALSKETKSYTYERIIVLLNASQAVGDTNPGLAVNYSKQAVEIAKSSEKIPMTELIKTLGEHTIAIWLSGEQKEAYIPWQEAAEGLMACKDNKDNWKGLFMIFGHVYNGPIGLTQRQKF